MIEYIQQLDKEVFIYLNSLGNPTWDWFWVFITNKWTFIPFYAFLIYLLYKTKKLQATIIILLFVAAMITCTDQGANLFKNGFKRLRPCNFDFTSRLLVHCGHYGFFSAHAASTMALAVYLGSILKSRYKYALVGLIGWSLVVGYSRIYVGVHFPGDVLVGWSIGAMIGIFFFYIQHFLLKRISFSLGFYFRSMLLKPKLIKIISLRRSLQSLN